MQFLRKLFWQACTLINSHFVGLVILFTVTMAYQNCAQYSNNPFNVESATTAPVSSPRLDIPTQQLEVATSDDQMSFGSTCQWGLSPQHYLEFKLYTMSSRPVKVQSTTACNTSTTADCYRNINFRCEHGRYYAVLPVTCDAYDNALGAISYTLTGQMVTYDANNNEVRDPQASFSRQVFIDWNQAAATACGH